MRTSRSVWLGRVAVAGPIAFTIAWLIGGLVQDDYSFRQEDISALAALDAQHAWIMITGFVLLGVGTIALAAGLASTLKYPSAVIGSVLLMIAGIGFAVVGLARNDCSTDAHRKLRRYRPEPKRRYPPGPKLQQQSPGKNVALSCSPVR